LSQIPALTGKAQADFWPRYPAIFRNALALCAGGSAVGAGDAAASPDKYFLGKFEQI